MTDSSLNKSFAFRFLKNVRKNFLEHVPYRLLDYNLLILNYMRNTERLNMNYHWKLKNKYLFIYTIHSPFIERI